MSEPSKGALEFIQARVGCAERCADITCDCFFVAKACDDFAAQAAAERAKPTASDLAKLADRIAALSAEYGWNFEGFRSAAIAELDAALAEARREGEIAMRERAAEKCEELLQPRSGIYIARHPGDAIRKLAADVRALPDNF